MSRQWGGVCVKRRDGGIKAGNRRMSHLSLQFPLLNLQPIFDLLGILCCRLVARHLTFQSDHLCHKKTKLLFGSEAVSALNCSSVWVCVQTKNSRLQKSLMITNRLTSCFNEPTLKTNYKIFVRLLLTDNNNIILWKWDAKPTEFFFSNFNLKF